MSKQNKLDFHQARVIHITWESHLDRPFESMIGSVPDWPKSQQCELGHWLNRVSAKKLQDFPVLSRIQKHHHLFHTAVDACYLAAQRGERDEFEKEKKQLRVESREILYLLTLLELEYRQQQVEAKTQRSAFQGLMQIFSPPSHDRLHKELHLNVSDARLFHVLWIQDEMENAFHGHARQADLAQLDHCDLGVWIHDIGLKMHADLPEIQLLNESHKSFHDYSRAVIGALRHGRSESADNAYAKLQVLSREIIYLLTRIEMHLGHSASITSEHTAL
ncbi:hypothetical protein Mmc1_1088 [Magnetococcus marinus MC-1]|uniref:Chemoreceptor zinc-binding domain-containing protein n=1 Tax=Magnetococcus marinus (strain ATCC BAA-1437 / JCM 17883 / MC-1) TaxID=156889 RepID=A0L6L3_MAGMM|nr:CZB domain-containing protein [Magnetococcus marinus]ABK43606.1 hypothetical protein Mmc1_1088 [Magnetococcus marinus MC-1]